VKKITFITTGQPTTNPRMVKEVELLIGLGYQVRVVYSYYQRWATAYDQEIVGRHPETYYCAGGDPGHAKITYWYTRVRHKVCAMLYRWLHWDFFAPCAINRTHAELLQMAKRHRSDLYIAHNLGALPAAIYAARHWSSKAGYDAEDMHSAEFDDKTYWLYLLNKYVEEAYFPKVAYFTAASQLIAENYKTAYPYLDPVVVDNAFPLNHRSFRAGNQKDQPLKLFWFSQTTGSGRGIEEVIQAIALAKVPAELHLLGNASDQVKSNLEKIAVGHGLSPGMLVFYEPVSHDQLVDIVGQFDIGMATETGIPYNREICLTNKLFMYIQCGLAVIASNTQGQQTFFAKYPGIGRLYQKNDPVMLSDVLLYYSNNRDELQLTRRLNYELGQHVLNWENESLHFKSLIASMVGHP